MSMSNEYLRAFVIGSCCLVFLPYFYVVSRFNSKKINFDYKLYTFLAPISLGLMNLASLLIAQLFGLSHDNRFLIMSIIAPTLVATTIILFKIYNYTKEEWIIHIVNLYIFYFIIFNFILNNLDKYV